MGTFIRLTDYQTPKEKEEAFLSRDSHIIKVRKESDFGRIKGSPYAYIATESLVSILEKDKTIGDVAKPRQGLASGKNELFYRMWYEVNFELVAINYRKKEDIWANKKKYVPVNKGGGFKKWYGNNFEVIKFDEENYNLLLASGNHLPSRELYFREGITWNKISSGKFSCRFSPVGYIFTDAGMKIICDKNTKAIGALLSSNIVPVILKVFSETLNYETGNISRIPVHFTDNQVEKIEEMYSKCVEDAKEEWDEFEISWEFKKHPLI